MEPNILILWIDSLSANVLENAIRSGDVPNISKFADRSVQFRNAIAVSSTTSTCTASLLTGLYPHNHGVRALRGYKLANEVETIASVFKKNGYNTVSYATGPLDPIIELDRGFSEYYWREKHQNLDGELSSTIVNKIHDLSKNQKPWLLFLHLWELHAPYWLSNDEKFSPMLDKLFLNRKYEKAFRGLDKSLGKIFEAVDFSSTIVVFMADHGEIIGNFPQRAIARIQRTLGTAPYRSNYIHLSHGSHLLEKLVKVPLLIRADWQLQPGIVEDSLVRQIDISPTLAQLAGIEWPTKIDGAVIFQKSDFIPPPQFVYLEAVGYVLQSKKNWFIGARTGKWKYIISPIDRERVHLLFNLDIDPEERHNVLGQHPMIVKEIQKTIEEINGCELDQMVWPSPNISPEQTARLEARLRDLGYL